MRSRWENNFNKTSWTVGRVNPHGQDWAKAYAQKDFSRQLIAKESFIKRLYSLFLKEDK